MNTNNINNSTTINDQENKSKEFDKPDGIQIKIEKINFSNQNNNSQKIQKSNIEENNKKKK